MIASIINTATIKSKLRPEYRGIAKDAQPFVDVYRAEALLHGIIFKKDVTIGFKKINDGSVVGLCHLGSFLREFREIDLDTDFWAPASQLTRENLINHEMTHCFCGRGHDWAEGKNYPETTNLNKILEKILNTLNYEERKADKGFFSDGCPMSIMFTSVLTDNCSMQHADHYKEEMFDRCQPY